MTHPEEHLPEVGLLTLGRVAAFLDIPTAEVKALIREGELPAVRIGSRLRVARIDVLRFVSRHRRLRGERGWV
jgi:excisionase family DNA binding protein